MRRFEDHFWIHSNLSPESSSRSAGTMLLNGNMAYDLCQCFTIACVLSIRVPSRSKRKPVNEWISAGPVKEGGGADDILEALESMDL